LIRRAELNLLLNTHTTSHTDTLSLRQPVFTRLPSKTPDLTDRAASSSAPRRTPTAGISLDGSGFIIVDSGAHYRGSGAHHRYFKSLLNGVQVPTRGGSCTHYMGVMCPILGGQVPIIGAALGAAAARVPPCLSRAGGCRLCTTCWGRCPTSSR
jgi:hypothetical protein